MIRTVLSNEGHLFNQDERLIFTRYNKLSRESHLPFLLMQNPSDLYIADARHILVRLCTRKPEKWFRLKDLDSYRKRFGDRIPDIMDELCRDLVKSIVEGPEPESEVELIDLTVDDVHRSDNSDTLPVPALPLSLQVPPTQDKTTNTTTPDVVLTVPVKTEPVEVQVKTEDTSPALRTVSVKVEDTDQGNDNSVPPSIPNSFSSETVPKVEELSQPGPSCLPPQPWEYVIVARDEEHAPIEDLLNCLAVEELQSLVRSLKVKCASKKVGQLPLGWFSFVADHYLGIPEERNDQITVDYLF